MVDGCDLPSGIVIMVAIGCANVSKGQVKYNQRLLKHYSVILAYARIHI